MGPCEPKQSAALASRQAPAAAAAAAAFFSDLVRPLFSASLERRFFWRRWPSPAAEYRDRRRRQLNSWPIRVIYPLGTGALVHVRHRFTNSYTEKNMMTLSQQQIAAALDGMERLERIQIDVIDGGFSWRLFGDGGREVIAGQAGPEQIAAMLQVTEIRSE